MSSATLRPIVFVIANMAGGGILQKGLSGGDRIAVECIKRWRKKGINIIVMTSKSGRLIYGLKDVKYVTISSPIFRKYSILGIIIFAFIALVNGILKALLFRNLKHTTVVYSASEFLPDLLPTLIIKRRNRNTKWIAAFYLFAPHPFSKKSPYRGVFSKIKNILYFSMQQISYRIVKNYADMVWVTNELDRWRFIDSRRLTHDRVIAVRGGVDTKTPALIPEPNRKKFDAVFIGRFHPQKGVLELIEIWKYVCEKKKNAKLAMIGNGDLEREVKKRISKYGLEDKVFLFGFKDYIEKIQIFKESLIVVHPAIYDSGGMAACEAMACGLPGVSFDLPALRTYYPKGMLKTPCFDLKGFAENILKLLNDQELYRKLQKEALELAKEWDWDKRTEELLKIIMSLMKNE
jgi:glycosyltransferase involved in cell wall biosynthesis